MKHIVVLSILLAGCVKQTPVPTPQNSPDGTVGTVALGPYAYFSPFACNMSATNLTCMATVDVSFLRGQRSYFIPRGYQFTFHTPVGQQGSAGIWFGCAQGNECDGFFMFGSPSVTATPNTTPTIGISKTAPTMIASTVNKVPSAFTRASFRQRATSPAEQHCQTRARNWRVANQ